MIVKLQPDQIAAFWDAIKHGALIANRPDNEEKFANRVLENLLAGKAQCWIGFDLREGERVIYGMGLTTLEEDSLYGVKYLYLHTLYAFRPIPPEVLGAMMPTLDDFAKAQGCEKMVVMTTNKRLTEYYQSQGFNQNLALFTRDL